MTTQTTFRCYYDDGTIEVAEVCLPINQYGAALLKSELQIIEDVTEAPTLPWLLIILALVAVLSKERK